VQCSHKTSASPKQNSSNLLDLEISNSLSFLLSNFEKTDSQISIENETSTIWPSTTHTSMRVVHSDVTQRSNDCGAKVTALTNIVYNSPFATIQYWLLKPKVSCLFVHF
jgi:hypothetical protein